MQAPHPQPQPVSQDKPPLVDPVVLLQKRKAFICERTSKLKDPNVFRAIHKSIGDAGYNALVSNCAGGATVNLAMLPEDLINRIYTTVAQKLTDQTLPDGF